MAEQSDFSKLVRQIRIDNNELIHDMSARTGLTCVYLSKIDCGEIIPPKSVARIIVYHYGFEGTDNAIKIFTALADITRPAGVLLH